MALGNSAWWNSADVSTSARRTPKSLLHLQGEAEIERVTEGSRCYWDEDRGTLTSSLQLWPTTLLPSDLPSDSGAILFTSCVEQKRVMEGVMVPWDLTHLHSPLLSLLETGSVAKKVKVTVQASQETAHKI